MGPRGVMLFRLAAISNWLVAIGGIVDPTWVALNAGITPSNYPFLVRIWTGLVFMFGAMFWEISRHPSTRHHLIKYAWIEKTITAVNVTLGYVTGEVPGLMFALILVTDYVWIPIFIYYDRATAPARERGSV